MTEHTPGSWEWRELDENGEDVELWATEADVSVVILDSGFAISAQSDSTWPADKALIAAAPETKRQRDELLAACERAIAVLGTMPFSDTELVIRAAVARAKGER